MPEAVAVASDAGPAVELSAVLAALGAPVEVRPKTSVDWANTPWEMSTFDRHASTRAMGISTRYAARFREDAAAEDRVVVIFKRDCPALCRRGGAKRHG
jgi:hypothetical protein